MSDLDPVFGPLVLGLGPQTSPKPAPGWARPVLVGCLLIGCRGSLDNEAHKVLPAAAWIRFARLTSSELGPFGCPAQKLGRGFLGVGGGVVRGSLMLTCCRQP